MKKYTSMAVAATVAVAALGTSCKKEKEDQTPVLLAAAATLGTKSATVSFSLSAGSTAVDCSSTNLSIAGRSDVQLKGARLYVSNVKLIDRAGQAIPVTLQTNNYQDAATGVALIDFEDGTTGACTAGTTGTNTALQVTLPYLADTSSLTGVEFDVGIPDAANRLNYQSTSTTAPFNASSMYWTWATAYKFTNIELKSGTDFSVLHLGSTGTDRTATTGKACDEVTPSTGTTPASSPCLYQNRPTIRVTTASFNLASNRVNLDLGALFSGAITWNASAMNSCMSGRTTGTLNAPCNDLFDHIGVDRTTGGSTGTQTAFSIR